MSKELHIIDGDQADPSAIHVVDGRAIWKGTYVGVVVHPGFGAGWSQDAGFTKESIENRLFNPQLVGALLGNISDSELVELVQDLFPGKYVDHIVECRVFWLHCLHNYFLKHYDGSELILEMPPIQLCGRLFHEDGETVYASNLVVGRMTDGK